MESPHFPRPEPSPPPLRKGGILDMLDQVAGLFVGRKVDVPTVEPTPEPYIDSSPQAPPYPNPLPASPGRYQQEVFYFALQPAGGPSDSAVVSIRTRCDFFNVTCWSNAATEYEGVWAELGANPGPIPVGTSNIPQQSPFFIRNKSAVTIHGAEQTLSVINGNNNIMQVIVVACTNVPLPYS